MYASRRTNKPVTAPCHTLFATVCQYPGYSTCSRELSVRSSRKEVQAGRHNELGSESSRILCSRCDDPRGYAKSNNVTLSLTATNQARTIVMHGEPLYLGITLAVYPWQILPTIEDPSCRVRHTHRDTSASLWNALCTATSYETKTGFWTLPTSWGRKREPSEWQNS
ncbi:uncharacterized protein EI90DRAFT_3080632, partial [Cantharellus anzutake]|uniref:uncharacterized protein n=1 Tax=Cantharellus anzutake TaxID=1750568 RepID=UPI0019065C03